MEHAIARCTMTIRTTLLGIAALTIAACGGSAGKAAAMTPETLRSELDAALPAGSSAETVTAYLAKRGFEHSALTDHAAMVHMGKNPAERSITAIVRDVERRGVVSTSITMTFLFKKSGGLVRTDVATVQTGP